ncbi:unnamed protein product, partial [Prorocentrum cordatum]
AAAASRQRRSGARGPAGPVGLHAALCAATGSGGLGCSRVQLLPRPDGPRSRSTVARRAYRFTKETMEAVMMAQAESRRLGQSHVGTEMLVVGVASEGTDAGSRALAGLGVGLLEARAVLEEVVGNRREGRTPLIQFTIAAKKVLEDSIQCASRQGRSFVGTSHLLRAILDQEEPDTGTNLLGRLLGCDTVEATRKKLIGALEREEATRKKLVGARERKESVEKTSASGSVAPVQGDVDLTQTLKYGKDLTEAAREGKMDPLIGREEELKRTIRILGRRSKNNPVLVGEAGVGKTSIAEGLAQRIAAGRVPATLKGKRVVQLDIALLLAGTRYRGDFEERLRAVVKEVSESNRRVILVIDEVHTLVGSGGNGDEGGGMDAANLLKPALARGELQCIGATTLDEYRKYIEKDPALERRFQPVTVPEPTQEEAVRILEGLASKYERHHELRYTQGALAAAVKLASQYIPDRFLPDKAIDVMDEAGSKVRQQLYEDAEDDQTAAELWEASQELKAVKAQKKVAVVSERFDEAQQLKVREAELIERLSYLQDLRGGGTAPGTQALLEELRGLKAQVQELVDAERFGEAHELKARERDISERISRIEGVDSAIARVDRPVTEKDMAEVVASWTGIAVEQVGASESKKLMGLEKALHKTIIGQDEAVDAVARALRRARAGLRNPDRPMASFIFCGPTGVGKTHVCKTLASTFFGSTDSMIRLDMSEFMEKHTVSKIIGAPPGYVGYNDGGTVTEAVRRRPYSLLLFDEVEKAHPDVFNIMLQLLDDGRLTDSKGRTVSFANTLVVMTSNLGSRAVQKGARGGFGLGGVMDDEEEESYAAMKEIVMEDMKSFFRPEFINRLDEVVVFRSLTKDNLRAIAENEFQQVLARLSESDLDVVLTQAGPSSRTCFDDRSPLPFSQTSDGLVCSTRGPQESRLDSRSMLGALGPGKDGRKLSVLFSSRRKGGRGQEGKIHRHNDSSIPWKIWEDMGSGGEYANPANNRKYWTSLHLCLFLCVSLGSFERGGSRASRSGSARPLLPGVARGPPMPQWSSWLEAPRCSRRFPEVPRSPWIQTPRAMKKSRREVFRHFRPGGPRWASGPSKNDSGRTTGPGGRVGTSRDAVLNKIRTSHVWVWTLLGRRKEAGSSALTLARKLPA